ncbi:MAG: hypothetical protein QOI93_4080, partial [Rhodospirillaceae bacterium]|nr:hypothetical protein [Rhodospirillaceae bacterium]
MQGLINVEANASLLVSDLLVDVGDSSQGHIRLYLHPRGQMRVNRASSGCHF